MILETDYECDGGAVRLIDFMPFAGPQRHSVIRILEDEDDWPARPAKPS